MKRTWGVMFLVSVAVIVGLHMLGHYYPNLALDAGSDGHYPGNLQGWLFCLACLTGVIGMCGLLETDDTQPAETPDE